MFSFMANSEGASQLLIKVQISCKPTKNSTEMPSSVHDIWFSWRQHNDILRYWLIFLGLRECSYGSHLQRQVFILWQFCSINLWSQHSKWNWFPFANGNSHSAILRQQRSKTWIHSDSCQLHAEFSGESLITLATSWAILQQKGEPRSWRHRHQLVLQCSHFVLE